MSIEAINWALNHAPQFEDEDPRTRPHLAFVLIGLANHADPQGRNAWPANETLCRYTRLSESTVRRCLQKLLELGVIRLGDPELQAFHNRRPGYRPTVYDLVMRGVSYQQPGVSQENGEGCHTGSGMTPEPSLNRPSEPEEISLELDLPESPSKNDARPSEIDGDLLASFEAFWVVYPRKVSKSGAQRKFEQAVKSGVAPGLIQRGVERYARQRAGQDPAFTKHPTTWLHNGCWADEHESAPRSTSEYRPYKDADVWGDTAGAVPTRNGGGWSG